MKHQEKIFPFPEVLPNPTETPWSVEEAQGMVSATTDLVKHVLAVPLTEGDVEEVVRVHELGHVAWTPQETPKALAAKHGVSAESLMVAENVRVNLRLRGRRVDIAAGVLPPMVAARIPGMVAGNIQEMEKNPDKALRTLVLGALDLLGTKNFDTLVQEIGTQGGEDLRKSFDRIINPIILKSMNVEPSIARDTSQYEEHWSHIPFSASIKMAKAIEQMVPKAMPTMVPTKGKGKGDGDEDGKPELGAMDMLPDGEDNPRPKFQVLPHVDWAKMDIEKPASKPYPKAKKALARAKARATDCGVRIRALDRILTDQKVFGTKTRVPGGTVLIDASGSMDWNRNDLLEIVKNAPGATVACYDGEREGQRGVLRILYDKGNIVEDRFIQRACDGANLIDGPALRWLNKQAGPRIWISDGSVTGIGEKQAPNLFMDVMKLTRQGQVTRIGQLGQAKKILDKLNAEVGKIR